MQKARRILCELRYQLVLRYYKDQKLQLTPNNLQDEVLAQNEPRTRTEVVKSVILVNFINKLIIHIIKPCRNQIEFY